MNKPDDDRDPKPENPCDRARDAWKDWTSDDAEKELKSWPRSAAEGVEFTTGLLQPLVPYRRLDVQVPARSEPWVAPPVRLADCPICAAKPGERCVGFDRWDECHFERLFACPVRGMQP
jgi:hypothetical protein